MGKALGAAAEDAGGYGRYMSTPKSTKAVLGRWRLRWRHNKSSLNFGGSWNHLTDSLPSFPYSQLEEDATVAGPDFSIQLTFSLFALFHFCSYTAFQGD